MSTGTASSTRHGRRPVAVAVALVLGMFGLVPAGPAVAIGPAQVHGVVTSLDTALGIPNVTVRLFGASNYYYGVTDSTGAYGFDDVADDIYTIWFDTSLTTAGSFVPEWWDNGAIESEALPVTLTAGDSETLNAQLATGGMITGNVTGNDGPGSFNVIAYLQDTVTPTTFHQFTNTELIGANGNYALRGLIPGNYMVTFGDNDQGAGGTNYSLEAFDDVRYPNGDLVTVTGTNTTPNINAEMTVPGPVKVDRIAGADRFETSAGIWSDPAKYPDNSGGIIYVANGRTFADALGAGPAAAQDNAPLMLIEQDSIPAVVKAQIVRIHPAQIIMVGGPAALSENVKAELETLATTVTRVSGTDRYDTSRELIESAFDLTQPAGVLIVATGLNFPDALSAGPATGTLLNSPVLLVPGTAAELDATTLALVNNIDPDTIVIVGGTSVVSPGVQASLEGTGFPVIRKAGADRYATSTAINDYFFVYSEDAYVAVGTGFADALSGAARAAKEGSPLYVTPSSCIPLPDMLDMRSLQVSKIYLLGGTAALDANVEGLHRC